MMQLNQIDYVLDMIKTCRSNLNTLWCLLISAFYFQNAYEKTSEQNRNFDYQYAWDFLKRFVIQDAPPQTF